MISWILWSFRFLVSFFFCYPNTHTTYSIRFYCVFMMPTAIPNDCYAKNLNRQTVKSCVCIVSFWNCFTGANMIGEWKWSWSSPSWWMKKVFIVSKNDGIGKFYAHKNSLNSFWMVKIEIVTFLLKWCYWKIMLNFYELKWKRKIMLKYNKHISTDQFFIFPLYFVRKNVTLNFFRFHSNGTPV